MNLSLRSLVPVLLSGVLLASAWLGFSGLILLIAFIPLLYVEAALLDNPKANSPVVFWGYSLLTFLTWNGLTTWWIWHATPMGAVFAVVTNSLLMSLVWWLSFLVTKKKGKSFGRIFLFFAWISFEYLHYHWDMSWPWLTLGNGFANDIKLIQWYEYTGVFGGTAWVLASNILLFDLLESAGERIHKGWYIKLSVVFLLIMFPVLFSLLSYGQYSEKNDPVEIVVAQPNIDPYNDKFGGMSPAEQLDRLLVVADSLGSPTTRFFVGPETALPDVWENEPVHNREINRIRQFLSQHYPQAAFVVGATTFRRYFPGDAATSTARYSADSSIIYDAYNAACFVKEGLPVGFYHKTKLVSGVEKMPFEKKLRFLKRLVIDLGGISGTLGTQTDTVLFRDGKAVVAVPICYESGYGEYMAGFEKKGANIFFIITNDGWWRNTPGYKQHLSYSRLRAIELRRSIARSANTGISCFINQRGDVLKKTPWWTMTSISGTLNLNDEITFYAQHGDYIARVSVFMFTMMLLLYVVDGIKALTPSMKRNYKKEPH